MLLLQGMKKNCLLSLLLLLLLVACNQKADNKQLPKTTQKSDSLSLKVAMQPTLDALPVLLGKVLGLYEKNGADVSVKIYNAQMDCDTAIIGGSCDGVVTDLVQAEWIKQQKVGLQYITSTNLNWKLISNRLDRIKKISQLSDKMLAVDRHSATWMLAQHVVDSVKPKYDVFFVQINDVNLRLDMLLNNEMNAVMLPEPQASVALNAGNELLWDGSKGKFQMGVIAFRERCFTQKLKKKQIEVFTKVYNAAIDSINRFGLKHYAAVLRKYYGLSDQSIQHLPQQLMFKHTELPKNKEVEIARKFILQ